MKKFWFYYWLVLIVVLLPAEALGAEGVLKDLPATEITGYGEYKLGSPVSQLDLTDFEGPVKDTSWGEHASGYNYGKVVKFTSFAGTTEIEFGLVTMDGRLEAISLKFTQLMTDFKDLDRVADFVRSLRDSILARYDAELVKGNAFAFSYSSPDWAWGGALKLEDKEGNILELVWDGYDLTIAYTTAEFWSYLDKAKKQAAEEDVGKL